MALDSCTNGIGIYAGLLSGATARRLQVGLSRIRSTETSWKSLFGTREEQPFGRDLDNDLLSWPKPTQPAALSRDGQPTFIVKFCAEDFVHKSSQIQAIDHIMDG
jgi:hypothetical protein